MEVKTLSTSLTALGLFRTQFVSLSPRPEDVPVCFVYYKSLRTLRRALFAIERQDKRRACQVGLHLADVDVFLNMRITQMHSSRRQEIHCLVRQQVVNPNNISLQ